MSVWVTDILDSSTRHTICVEVGIDIIYRYQNNCGTVPFL